MARRGTTGESRLVFLPTLAGAAPTLAELGTAVDLTRYLTRDGFDAPVESSYVDASDAADRVDKQIAGNIATGKVTLTCYRDSVPADDDAWTTLAADTDGWLVERPFGGSTAAWTAGQIVNAYRGVVSARSPMSWGEEARKFTSSFAVEERREDVAVVAA